MSPKNVLPAWMYPAAAEKGPEAFAASTQDVDAPV
jgi:hypothetical protein